MRRRTGPVQQWVDSIPSPTKSSPSSPEQPEDIPGNATPAVTPKEISLQREIFEKKADMTASTPIIVPNSPAITMTGAPSSVPFNRLVRDPSLQSDSSHCSSVESLLEWRKADPEAILLGLGFGGCPSSPQENGPLSRIPRRFLQPSKLKGIAINDFLKHQQETSESFDSASLGYRGLTGSPYVAPSEIVQKIMERLREHESNEIDPYAAYNSSGEPFSPSQQEGRLSVLSPDNRLYLERPRSKSPDMRNKRMIIGQKSFAFGCDGDLIEISASDNQDPSCSLGSTDYQLNLDDPDINSNTQKMHTKLGPKYSEVDLELYSNRFEKRLAKQLSFDEETSSMEISDQLPEIRETDGKVEFKLDYQRQTDLQRISEERTDSEEQRDSLVTVISRRTSNNDSQLDVKEKSLEYKNETDRLNSNPRRASEGSYDAKPNQRVLMPDEGRRFSDGVMQTGLRKTSNESLLSDRRKSLRRQARVTDSDAVEYCGKECLDVLEMEPVASEEVIGGKEIIDEERIESVDKLEENQRVMAVKTVEEDNLSSSKRTDRLEPIKDDDEEQEIKGACAYTPGRVPKITGGAVKRNQEFNMGGRLSPLNETGSVYEDAQLVDNFTMKDDAGIRNKSRGKTSEGSCSEPEEGESSSKTLPDSAQTTTESDEGLCCPEMRQHCCQSDRLGQICEHENSNEECCYNVKSTNCWRKMAKMMKNNKKLEDMVVKSRQEMAEIRDMFSSVMSVRMEPGF